MVHVVYSLGGLIAALDGYNRIGVDGTDGAGKSTVSRMLASALNLPLVEIDTFLVANTDMYLGALRLGQLQAAVPTQGPILIEGICLFNVLSAVDRRVDRVVYVKRMHHGVWADEGNCVFPDGLAAGLLRARSNAAAMSAFSAASAAACKTVGNLLPVTEEMMRYHETLRPHDRAHIVLEWSHGMEPINDGTFVE